MKSMDWNKKFAYIIDQNGAEREKIPLKPTMYNNAWLTNINKGEMDMALNCYESYFVVEFYDTGRGVAA